MSNLDPGTYLATYRYKGSDWDFEFKAESLEDAKLRKTEIPYGRTVKIGNRVPGYRDYRTYTLAYEHEGRECEFDLPATDAKDVEARLAAIYFGKVLGRLEMEIPAGPGAGIFVRAVCWFRNAFRAA